MFIDVNTVAAVAVPCHKNFTNSHMLRHGLRLLMNVGFLFIAFLPPSLAP